MAGSELVDFHLTDRRGAYDFVTRTLRRLNYGGLTKADKGVVRRFVAKVTGLSRAQSTRLIDQYQNRAIGRVAAGGCPPAAPSYGRNAHCCAPPAQIRTWSLNHPAPTSGD